MDIKKQKIEEFLNHIQDISHSQKINSESICNELNNQQIQFEEQDIQLKKIYEEIENKKEYKKIISKYIHNYIDTTNKKVSFNNFKLYITKKLEDIKTKTNLHEQLKITEVKKEEIPITLQNIEETLTILLFILNNEEEQLIKYLKDINESKYIEIKKQEYNDYEYSKLEEKNKELLKEIIDTTIKKYNYNNAIKALENYKKTTNTDYITRTNNLREKVEKSKTFLIYLNFIDLKKELNQIIRPKNNNIKPSKDLVLEEICLSTYNAFQTKERNYSGKIQVARTLIKMQTNDYDSITRFNNARNLAKEHIKAEEIKKLVTNTLEENGYIIENELDLYELYATHIEHISNKKENGE